MDSWRCAFFRWVPWESARSFMRGPPPGRTGHAGGVLYVLFWTEAVVLVDPALSL
jgi:hypothetical protein